MERERDEERWGEREEREEREVGTEGERDGARGEASGGQTDRVRERIKCSASPTRSTVSLRYTLHSCAPPATADCQQLWPATANVANYRSCGRSKKKIFFVCVRACGPS